ncbi:hypothetical protein CSKR_203971 [Clonorchis sinensis]|uniref:PDZ domain-containing protein n=1 Tax=Clonorchis sinensis TaxID=79923 RepID=A0A8T1MMB1_CLOSI|nr:hypothetical protein CSKR_203971 [Clonorchis sinensis]
MSKEEGLNETNFGEKESQPESGANGVEHAENSLIKEGAVHFQDSEDEHFEEAQSERPGEEPETKEEPKQTQEEGEEYVVILEEEENKVADEPEVVQEKVTRKQQDDQVCGLSEMKARSKENDSFPCNMNGTSSVSPNEFSQGMEPNSRVVSNAIPSMNSHANDRLGAVVNEFAALTAQDDDKHTPQPTIYQRRTNPPQRSIYHRSPSDRKVAVPSWYTPPSKPITNIVPAPPPYEQPMQHGYQTIDAAQSPSVTSPTRKISNNTPYVGSHVIASETGPSLTVLLRRPTSERQWGFSFYGGAEFGCPPFVNKVTKNGLAFQQGIEVGDVIVSICKTLTVGKTHDQLKAEILRAGNDLDLVLIRKGVDLEKLAQIVPQVFQCATRSPPSSVSYGSVDYAQAESPRARSGQSLTRGRSFRSVKTKSIRILEEQLSGGQNPSSAVATKQHLQGARGLPAAGSMSSYTTAYGQNVSQGYSGRQIVINPTNAGHLGASNDLAATYGQQYSSQPNYGSDVSNQYAGNARGMWETRSDYGVGNAGGGGGWSGSVSPHGQQTYHSPNNPDYIPPATQNASASITVPLHGRQAWPTQYM